MAVKPNWKLIIRSQTYPTEVWDTMIHPSGKRYTFLTEAEAETELAKLKRVQPHLEARVAPM